jgi:EmrB/QacA subfamily drug resistance transporter
VRSEIAGHIVTTTAAPAGAPTEGTLLSHKQILVVFTGLMLGVLLASLDGTIVSTALPSILSDIGGGTHLSWVVTAYLLTSTASTPLYGKISDLYGRKSVFQFAIVSFLVGSALCGLSQNIGQLVAFRAVQGIGAGGLVSLALAIIGDIISPRDRGRYQGYFGAVFGISSVAGPLIGGFFTDSLSWRWVFYVNLPLGLIAFAVTGVVLRLPYARREAHIDYSGAAVLIGGVSTLLLATVWGGQEYAWSSATIIGLLVASVALLVIFILVERAAPEPILPPHLFKNPVFVVAGVVSFIIGAALFGVIVYIPEYLQVTHDSSATRSGLQTLPLMVGVLTSSIGTGRLISRIGRYKSFVVAGTFFTFIGLIFMATINAHTSLTVLSAYMLVVGLGLGACMQNLTLAVQNAVDYRDLGTATAAATFFRSLGGAVGVAVLGAVFTNRLTGGLDKLGTGGKQLNGSGFQVKVVQHLPEPLHGGVLHVFADALDKTFYLAVVLGALAFIGTLFLPELKLGERSGMESAEAARQAAAEEETAASKLTF